MTNPPQIALLVHAWDIRESSPGRAGLIDEALRKALGQLRGVKFLLRDGASIAIYEDQTIDFVSEKFHKLASDFPGEFFFFSVEVALDSTEMDGVLPLPGAPTAPTVAINAGNLLQLLTNEKSRDASAPTEFESSAKRSPRRSVRNGGRKAKKSR